MILAVHYIKTSIKKKKKTEHCNQISIIKLKYSEVIVITTISTTETQYVTNLIRMKQDKVSPRYERHELAPVSVTQMSVG